MAGSSLLFPASADGGPRRMNGGRSAGTPDDYGVVKLRERPVSFLFLPLMFFRISCGTLRTRWQHRRPPSVQRNAPETTIGHPIAALPQHVLSSPPAHQGVRTGAPARQHLAWPLERRSHTHPAESPTPTDDGRRSSRGVRQRHQPSV